MKRRSTPAQSAGGRRAVKPGRSAARVKSVTGADQRPRASSAARGEAEPRRRGKARESAAARQARAGRILAGLRALYPDATCALRHESALQLLVATILSAQCTDARVNLVTPALFARYPDARAYAEADPAELEGYIRSTGFYRNKARNLIGMGAVLLRDFGGEVPAEMDKLLTLPGVARKTANCVLGTWYRKNVGVVVDTHVGRLAVRLALTPSARDGKDAVRIETDLRECLPAESWTYLSHALIEHGRRICDARRPRCGECRLARDCPSAGQAV